MAKRKNPRRKKPRGQTMLLTVPPDLGDWLAKHTEKLGASSIQETVRQILTAARTEQEQQAA